MFLIFLLQLISHPTSLFLYYVWSLHNYYGGKWAKPVSDTCAVNKPALLSLYNSQ